MPNASKKYKGYEDIKDINAKKAEDKTEKPTTYRTLFIGLGGTGGEVLNKLRALMSDEEKKRAHIIYMDMDSKDVRRLKAKGMNAVCLSSSDTVQSVMNYLGDYDGVRDWLPYGDNDTVFLSSKTDDGASQYRMKSRLCMAKYLSNRAGEFNSLLDSICAPGSLLANETLRVMIVSSVAGGTGAGTFIQVALYLREYFRSSGHKDITIMGLFACPDLFVKASNADARTKAKKENMYANAYAAVRELNAMNLAVNKNETARKKEGYGKNINISINTQSEGPLFDSNDPKLAENTNNKPFDLLYFIDVNNTQGGVLRSLDQYYGVMADIAYTRLYSPIEAALRSDESNELDIHSKYPTAIYASAGYGRIIYPYHDILNYLAVRKTADELDYTWSIMDNEWTKFKRTQQMMAKASGTVWTETSEERGKRFIIDMTAHLDKPNSRLRGLKYMVRDGDSIEDRAEEFIKQLEAVTKSGDGIDSKSAARDAIFGLHKEEEVSEQRRKLSAIYNKLVKAKLDSKNAAEALSALQTLAKQADVAAQAYGSALKKNLLGRALLIATQIAPKNAEDAVLADKEKSPLNLYHGLLSINGVAVHPLAARYLLYRLREKMEEAVADKDLVSKPKTMEALCMDLKLALDKPGDKEETTVEMRIKQLEKQFFFRGIDTTRALELYAQKLKSVAAAMMKSASRELLKEVYVQVLVVVNKLIEQYEGLFDNLKQYKDKIAQELQEEADRHESAADNRCIFINASREAKEYLYSGDLRTREMLQKGAAEIDAAAGKGIYDSLIRRTWAIIEQEEHDVLTEYTTQTEDTFSDLGSVFTEVMRIYGVYLEKNATHLNCSVVEAMVNDICQTLNIPAAERNTPENKNRISDQFGLIMKDMIEKADPMLNYVFNNTEPYYEGEDTDIRVTSTTPYLHLGLSPEQKEDLTKVYGGKADDALAKFEEDFGPSRGAVVSTEMSAYEMICFRAVHCLQPTQINKFHEENARGYYPDYMKRLRSMHATQQFSSSPHLDKRWHLREAMPYISRTMEQAWIKKTAKAFVNELLAGKFSFVTDSDGVTCFTYKQEGMDDVHVYWPESKLVTINDISRLVEYLQEQDARVERLGNELDEVVENVTAVVSKHADKLSTYKATLTTNDVLTDLRSNLLQRKHYTSTLTAAHGKKASGKKSTAPAAKLDLKRLSAILGSIDGQDIVDSKNSLGGILNIAWLVHASEERQNRDNDFGEAILDCVLEIVDKLCLNVFSADIDKNSNDHADYKDLYNSILEKFMQAYVMGVLSQLKRLDPDWLESAEKTLYYRYLSIPVDIMETKEYEWISKHWKLM